MTFQFCVVGAGPAGIAAVGKLLDAGISSIAWIDSHFDSGDLHRKWNQVPSNTKVSLFMRYFNACASFRFADRPTPFPIESLPPEQNCPLYYLSEPLLWITRQLKEQVTPFHKTALSIEKWQDLWAIQTESELIQAEKVILAIGSEPKVLPYLNKQIPLQTALNPTLLAKQVDPADTIGVFGSSHSAVLALANLHRLHPKRLIQFYRSPHRYAVYYDDWILYDDTGLKGFAAKWAKEHLDHPSSIEQIHISDSTFQPTLAQCTQLVHAVGFERRTILGTPLDAYNPQTGEIGENLYGLGIAYPEAKINRMGLLEYRVGLWKFIDYLDSILHLWTAAPCSYTSDAPKYPVAASNTTAAP